MNIYVRLRELRKAHGLRQSELGEILGINQSNVSRIEEKGRSIDEVMYQRLVEKFGDVEVSRFVGQHTWQNLLGRPRQGASHSEESTESSNTHSDISALVRVIAEQQKTIERLEKENAELRSSIQSHQSS